MNPSLVVAVTGTDHTQTEILAQIGGKLRRRGLRVHRLRNWRDTPIGDFDILLVGCNKEAAIPLAKQLEHLWTQKWNRWYAESRSDPAPNRRRSPTCRHAG